MRIDANLDHNPYDIEPAFIEEVCSFALSRSKGPENSEVSVTFVDNDEMAALNEDYRGKTGPTDVLSFECDNLDDDFPSQHAGSAYLLGDIVIAPDVANKQAVEYGSTLREEIGLLCIHGILHLQGYDHIEDDDAEVMEALQKEIFAAWRSRESENA